MNWTKQLEKQLIEKYSGTCNKELCIMFNTTEKAITTKAYRLGLVKSKSHISSNISNRNKLVGRNLNIEGLRQIASKYKTRGEFQIKDPSAYTTARRLKILDDVCSHMFKKHSVG